MSTPSGRGPKHRHRRRQDQETTPIVSPKQVLAKVQAAPTTPASAEEPLSAKEIAQLKIHFRFLREHRNILKLRVNAAEDLLLNGVKEPTHRGICQHLLAKVERARVLTVSQTMPPAEAVRLLGGVLRFAPDVSYLLRYLECVKQTASQKQAGAALTEVLDRIDYAQLSAAQMRQLVALIVDVFAERDLPVFLFTLLYDRSFREALDRSLEGFPEVLSRMMRPLRALHEVVTQAGSRRQEQAIAPSVVKQGMDLLLDVEPSSLTNLPESTRRRLLHLAADMMRGRQRLPGGALQELFSSLNFAQPEHKTGALMSLVVALLSSGQPKQAKALIEHERALVDTHPELKRWRDFIETPSIGDVVLEGTRSRAEKPATGRWIRGWHLPSQSSVLVRCGTATEQASYAEQIELWRSLLIPSVARVVSCSSEAGLPLIAVQLPGVPLGRELKGNGRIAEQTRRDWAIQLCSILSALAHSGVSLADAELRRFNLVDDGGLFLVDLWPLRNVGVEQSMQEHLGFAKRGVLQLLESAPCYGLGDDAETRVVEARSLAELVQRIDPRV